MEEMAVELLVSSLWELEEFLTKTRHSIKVKGGWSDIDVIGVKPKEVRLAECKVTGKPGRVKVITKKNANNIIKKWVPSIDNIALLWKEKPDWLPSESKLKTVEFWFCGNIWFPSTEERILAEKDFSSFIKSKSPKAIKNKVQGKIYSTLELFEMIIEVEKKKIVDDKHGKRFGNPILDTVRELIRYSNPKPLGGGRVKKLIQEDTRKIIKALGL